MATVANFSIRNAQKLLNNLSHHNKPTVPQKNNLATLDRTLQLAIENLDQFQQENWDLCDQETLNQLLDTIATLEKRTAQVRNQLSHHLSNEADCCPHCGNTFIIGMESCLSCGWNTVQLALQNYTQG
jgi:DNA repair exonuclease SbcCD ATPase subunit